MVMHRESQHWRIAPPGGSYEGRDRALKWLLVVVLVAAAARGWWIASVDTQPSSDFHWYFQRAMAMFRGEGYSVDGKLTAYWPIGYPALLSFLFFVAGPSVMAAKVLNVLLGLVAVYLTYCLGARLFRSHAVGLISAVLMALHPTWVMYSGIVASEPLFTATMLGGALAALNARGDPTRLLVSGLLFGAAVYTRPQAIVIPLIVLVCAYFWDDDTPRSFWFWKATAKVYLVIALVLSPWLIRNYLVYDRFVFVSTNGGDNLLIGNNAKATGRYMSPESAGLVRPPEMSEPERDSAAARAAWEYASTNKRRTLSLWPEKLKQTFLTGSDGPYWAFQDKFGEIVGPDQGPHRDLYRTAKLAGTQATQILTWAFLVSLPLLLVLRLRLGERGTFPITGLALIGYSAVLSVVFFGNPRFLYPVVPFMAMYGVQVLSLAWAHRPSLGGKGREIDLQDRPGL